MSDLKDDFDVFRGDLLYGQSRDRGTALQYLHTKHQYGQFIVDAAEAGAWVTVDNLNIPLHAEQNYLEQPDVLWGVIKQGRDALPAQLNMPTYPSNIALDQAKRNELNQQYQDNLKAYLKQLKHSPLSPLKSLDAPADKLDREGWGLDLANNRYYLAIRRACKFGIEYVAANTSGQAYIHFVLNRFDQGTGWVDVLEKKTFTASSGRETMLITYSELRYVYKNWNKFSPRVRFYRYLPATLTPNTTATSFPSCPAPWEDDSRQVNVPKDDLLGLPAKTVSLKTLWSDYYGPKKAKAYKELVESLKKASSNYQKNTSYVDNWLNKGNTAICNNELVVCQD